MILKFLTIGLVLSGIVLLLVSIQPVLKICNDTERPAGAWHTIFVLLLLFVFGYTSFALVLLEQGQVATSEVIIASVFFAGSIFVKLVINSSIESIQQIKRISAIELHHAFHDDLTGLPNRKALYERIDALIADNRQKKSEFAVLMMDLDHFKEVNDALGHQTGDRLIQTIAPRIRKMLRNSDTLARLGGDEFAVLLPATGITAAMLIASNIHHYVEQPFTIDDHHLRTGISIGIAMFPKNGGDADTLLQHADVAMYHAKEAGTGCALYDASEDQYTINRLKLLCNIRDAMNDGQFHLYYQPVVDVRQRKVWGVEALLRWQHPELGMIYPDEFIPLALQANLMKPLSLYVLRRALSQLAGWQKLGLELNISINMSIHDIQNKKLPDLILELIDEFAVQPKQITLEITENNVMTDSQLVYEVIDRLHKIGISLAIDDFGTGYSSLSYLKKIPADKLKVDKSFVRDMALDENDAVIVRSTIDLAHNMGRQVVAEGVECRDAFDLLEILGCDYIQGNFICEPVPDFAVLQWCLAWPTQVAGQLRYTIA